ncbi:fimbrial protein [Lelliottia sp. CFBP8978]|uniref:fimbrial protein n=1 Tax=Lelliottia sp. CFBP8978 TaxID=3096522 RepID=UPI002A6B775F|nr:fimbrial protein [Lelliottia sp. CFBP8978]MDY1035414.1 fimbrial protein [Lelliottia sp. CFBP8978]
MSKMFFKKMALASLVAASAMASSMANADDNPNLKPLTISGNITADACQVMLNRNTLDLGTLLVSDIKTSDQAPWSTGVRTLQIVIASDGSGECTVPNAEVNVLGVGAAGDSTILANTASESPAGNVGVAVWNNDDGAQVAVNGDAVKFSGSMAKLDFGLAKADSAAAVTPGNVSTTAQIKVTFL